MKRGPKVTTKRGAVAGKQVHLRLSPSEYAHVAKLARLHGCTIQRVLRETIAQCAKAAST